VESGGTIGTPWLWVGFNLFILAMLAVDLLVFHREAHAVRIREAAIWSAVWIVLSLSFGAGLWLLAGHEVGLEFLAGYLIEKSLSVDNLFVFLLILGHFRVDPNDQHRVLFWGVIGAILMRIAFILAGAAAVQRYSWVMYGFGAFLVLSGAKMLLPEKKDGQQDDQIERSLPIRMLRRVLPITPDYVGHHFVVRQNGAWMATPMLAVLVVVETSDVLFALDSIPAVFGVTTDPFIVYTSNILAVLGLRALYFLLVGVLSMLRYLKYGLAAVLVFIGAKMLSAHYFEIGIGASLGVIGLILAVTVAASLTAGRPLKGSLS
jgi:tellurite resistance protein TerC